MSFTVIKLGQPVAPPNSIADQIYESLKSSIIDGKIEPGHRLFEVELASSFRASRTPVRGALRRLEQDHLIERLASGGVRVTEFDWQAIQDLFSLRAVLEMHAIDLACDRITPEQIAALKQIRAQALGLQNSGEINRDYLMKRVLELNSSFHETIYKATGSPYLMKLISHLRGIVVGMRSMSIKADWAWTQTWDEHDRLIGHLERGEKEAATKLIKDHVANAASHVRSVVNTKKGSPADASAARD
jgi:DNA-binding GntR family transcriptional regulator